MTDIFISYAREDRSQAERLARALQGKGFDVWWDLNSLRGGKSFNVTIRQALERAKCVIALWSSVSVTSKWVGAEAYWAWENNKLHSVRLSEAVRVPVPYNTIHARNLASWDGSANWPEFRRLLADIAAVVGRNETNQGLPTSQHLGVVSQPSELKPTAPTKAKQSARSEIKFEGGLNASEGPHGARRYRPRVIVGLSVMAGVVGTVAALVVYLNVAGPKLETGTEPVTEVTAQPRLDAVDKPDALAESTLKHRDNLEYIQWTEGKKRYYVEASNTRPSCAEDAKKSNHELKVIIKERKVDLELDGTPLSGRLMDGDKTIIFSGEVPSEGGYTSFSDAELRLRKDNMIEVQMEWVWEDSDGRLCTGSLVVSNTVEQRWK